MAASVIKFLIVLYFVLWTLRSDIYESYYYSVSFCFFLVVPKFLKKITYTGL